MEFELDMYYYAVDLFKKEKRYRKEYSLSEIKKMYNLKSNYEVNIVKQIKNIFKHHGYTIEDLELKYKNLEIKYKTLRKKYTQLLTDKSNIIELIETIQNNIINNINSKNNIYESNHLGSVNTSLFNDENTIDVILFISDWHVGNIVKKENVNYTNEYNISVIKNRIHQLVNKLTDIVNMYRTKYVIDTIYIVSLGDMISGDIHDELIKSNEFNTIEQSARVTELLVSIIKMLSNVFDNIHFIGITGNHGRNTTKKEYKDITNSFDYMAYITTQTIVESTINANPSHYNYSNITFEIPTSKYIVKNIRGFNFLFEHGDDIKTYSSIPYSALIREFNNKNNNYLSLHNEPINYLCLGHFHTPITIHMNIGDIIVNGSLVGIDEYGYYHNLISKPSQTVIGINNNGKVFHYDIILNN